jgi:hypothetical protein
MQYTGPERRKHRVYVTRNSEYHVRAGVCVAVRNRTTESWFAGHMAVGRQLVGALRFAPGGIVPHVGEPETGDAIYFREGDHDVITSRLERIDRPAREVVAEHYPAEV